MSMGPFLIGKYMDMNTGLVPDLTLAITHILITFTFFISLAELAILFRWVRFLFLLHPLDPLHPQHRLHRLHRHLTYQQLIQKQGQALQMEWSYSLGLTVRCIGFFFLNETFTAEIYPLSLHDALPI